MPARNTAIFAVYPTHASAEAALSALKAKGFDISDISVVAPQSGATAAQTSEMGAVSSEPTAAESGAAPAIGTALGWLANLSSIAVSGAILVAAGPVMAAFKGMSDAVLGVADALIGLGIPADEAKKYEDRVRDGAILLSVHADGEDWISRGRVIFEETGAEDISSMYKNKPIEVGRLAAAHAE